MEQGALLEYLETPEFVAASTNATRLVSKLKTAATTQQFYETHQILRTVYYRFVNIKEKVPALVNLLYQGSCFLLKHKEFTSGQDTAILFLETASKQLQNYRDEGGNQAKLNLTNTDLTFHATNKTLDWDISSKVANLAVNIPDSEIGQSKFIAEALKILTPKILNRDLFHHCMASRFWKQKDLVNSRYHFLHCANSRNAEDIADLLIEYCQKSDDHGEADLFIAQFILQFLCLQRPADPPTLNASTSGTNPVTQPPSNGPNHLKTRSSIKSIAQKIFATYCLRHPKIGQASISFDRPLLNFIFFIISLLDSNSEASAYKLLCKVYKKEYMRDPKYESYLTRIGTIYLGIVDQSKQQQGGFFNNILMSLFDGADDDDDDNGNNTGGGSGQQTQQQHLSSFDDELD